MMGRWNVDAIIKSDGKRPCIIKRGIGGMINTPNNLGKK